MRLIYVYEDEILIISKKGKFVRAADKGFNNIKGNETAIRYSTDTILEFNNGLSRLKADRVIKDTYDLVEVKFTEVGLLYEGNIFKRVLTEGCYCIAKTSDKRIEIFDTSNLEVDKEISEALINKSDLSRFIRKFTVSKYCTGLLYINGVLDRKLSSGNYYFWINSYNIQLEMVDSRRKEMELSGQEILTKDKANIRINFDIVYKVTDINLAIETNTNYERQLYLVCQLALRAYVGTKTLDQLLENKDKIETELLEMIVNKVERLGVVIYECGMRDIILTGDMKEILNKVLIAEKKAQANSILRREETASTRSLLNTAKLMENNDMLFKLKQMEYLENIAEKVGGISVDSSSGILKQFRTLFAAE